MPCCGAKVQDVVDETHAPKFFKRRWCTDVLCLLLLFVFIGGIGFCAYIGVVAGDATSLVYGTDYLGNRCGMGDYSGMPKIYYPRIDQDVLDQYDVAVATPWRLRFYGLCMETCPSPSVDACIANPSSCMISDYGTTAQQEAAGGQATWYATMNTLDLINRCVPLVEADSSHAPDRCVIPPCDNVTNPWMTCDTEYPTTWVMEWPDSAKCEVALSVIETTVLTPTTSSIVAEQLGTTMEGLSRFVESIYECYVELLVCGICIPVLMGIVFLLLFRFFAKTVIYLTIFLIGAMLFCVTIYLFVKTDLIPSDLIDQVANLTAVACSSCASTVDAAWNTTDQVADLFNTHTESMIALAPDSTTEAASSISSDSTFMQVLAWISLVVFFIYVVLICISRKKIKVAAAVVKETSVALKDRPGMMLFPIGPMIVHILLFVLFVVLIMLLCSTTIDVLSVATSAATSASSSYADYLAAYNDSIADVDLSSIDSSNSNIQYATVAYCIFGYLWLMQIVSNVAWTAMAGAIGHWYFCRKDDTQRTFFPLWRSLGRTLFYHLGSVAFGSLIMAIVQFIRVVLYAIDKQTKKLQDSNFLAKLVIKCTQCCMWCLEKTLKFITDYCFIYIAILGSSFCRACKDTFTLVWEFPAQLAINSFVQTILRLLQSIIIPLVAGWVIYEILTERNKPNPTYATALAVIIAFVIARIFAMVFECTNSAIFVCATTDIKKYEGAFLSDRLRKAFGLAAGQPAGYGGKEGGGEGKSPTYDA